MAECNHKGQLICRQEPRNLLSFKCPIFKCKQHEFSVKMLGISHLSGLKIHIRVDTADHVALVSDVMTIRRLIIPNVESFSFCFFNKTNAGAFLFRPKTLASPHHQSCRTKCHPVALLQQLTPLHPYPVPQGNIRAGE